MEVSQPNSYDGFRRDWRMWVQWWSLSTIGWLISWYVSLFAGPFIVGSIFQAILPEPDSSGSALGFGILAFMLLNFVSGILFGLIYTGLQALFLRNRTNISRRWIIAGTLSYLIAGPITLSNVGSLDKPSVVFLIVFSVSGLVASGIQWIVLRQHLRLAAHWICTSLLGSGCAVALLFGSQFQREACNYPRSSQAVTDAVALNGRFVLRVSDRCKGMDVWSSDGTDAGTKRILDVTNGRQYVLPRKFSIVNDQLFFAVPVPTGWEVWTSDGTESGTQRIKTFTVEEGTDPPTNFLALGNALYFTFATPEGDIGIWRSDGTATGTQLWRTLLSPPWSLNIPLLQIVAGKMYFVTVDPETNRLVLWQSDGTDAGTTKATDVLQSADWYRFVELDGRLFFTRSDHEYGQELWTSDGTVEGTRIVADINPDPQAFGPSDLTLFRGNVFFKTTDAEHGREVWRTDGTREGTFLLKDLLPGPDSLTRVMLTPLGNTLYIQSSDGEGGCTFWRSDGTPAGTVPIDGVCPGEQTLTDVNSTVYFAGYDERYGFELWKTDGTQVGTALVKDLLPGSLGSGPHYLTNVNGTLFFLANNAKYGLHGFEIWRSDGTATGTVLVKDVGRP